MGAISVNVHQDPGLLDPVHTHICNLWLWSAKMVNFLFIHLYVLGADFFVCKFPSLARFGMLHANCKNKGSMAVCGCGFATRLVNMEMDYIYLKARLKGSRNGQKIPSTGKKIVRSLDRL